MITIEVRINPKGAGIDCLVILEYQSVSVTAVFPEGAILPPRLLALQKKGPKYDWLKNYDFKEIVWDRRRFFSGWQKR